MLHRSATNAISGAASLVLRATHIWMSGTCFCLTDTAVNAVHRTLDHGDETMPAIDVVIPEGDLSLEAETRLLKEVTNILITAEGFNTSNPIAQAVTVLFLHRPAAVFVGGERSTAPRYRVTTNVPEGKYSDEAVKTLIREINEAFARAAGTSAEEMGKRLAIFPVEIPEGRWGSQGVVRPIADIQAMIAGEGERAVGHDLLARRRRVKAQEVIEGLADAVRHGNAKS